MQLTFRQNQKRCNAARPALNLFTGQSFTMCDIDWVSP